MSRVLTFTRRPIEVQAIQLREDTAQEVVTLLEANHEWWRPNNLTILRRGGKLISIDVNTPTGTICIMSGQWLVYGAYDVKPEIWWSDDFEARYEYKPTEFGPGRPPYESTVKTE